MEAPNLLPILVKLLREKNAGITDEAINKYISYWQSLRPARSASMSILLCSSW